MDFSSELSRHVARVEVGIDSLLPPAGERPARLHAAMRYAIQGGGKRLRPVLVLAAGELLPGGGAGHADPLAAAVAVECLHTYSLIHDDLPCMDDDDLRRGRATTHRAFDEATALLAGDALLTHAFALIGDAYAAQPALAVALLRTLSGAADSRRLIGGQMEDLLAEKEPGIADGDLAFIHLNKTAAMIEAALVMGGICAGMDEARLSGLRAGGRSLGMAFQITDDILDATSDSATLGKTAGKDARAGKATFATRHGIESSRRQAAEHTAAAISEFQRLPSRAPFLVALTENMSRRLK